MVVSASTPASGSRMCERKVRPFFGRRLVRLEWSSPDLRHLVAVAVRTWNEVHSCNGNGGCKVSAPFFSFLQVLARRVARVVRYWFCGKLQVWCRLGVFGYGKGKATGLVWFCWHEGDGSGMLASGLGLGRNDGWLCGTRKLRKEVRSEERLSDRKFKTRDGTERNLEESGQWFRGMEQRRKVWVAVDELMERKGDSDKASMVMVIRNRMEIGRLKMITCLDYGSTWAIVACTNGPWKAGWRERHSLTPMIGRLNGLIEQMELNGFGNINWLGPGG
ncbi:hypothetical protein V6N13_040389 [Hibiscus sabdariffa]